jgi:hypothetical protein
MQRELLRDRSEPNGRFRADAEAVLAKYLPKFEKHLADMRERADRFRDPNTKMALHLMAGDLESEVVKMRAMLEREQGPAGGGPSSLRIDG